MKTVTLIGGPLDGMELPFDGGPMDTGDAFAAGSVIIKFPQEHFTLVYECDSTMRATFARRIKMKPCDCSYCIGCKKCNYTGKVEAE